MLTERDLLNIRPYLVRKAQYCKLPENMEEDLVQETLMYMWQERTHFELPLYPRTCIAYEREKSLQRWARHRMIAMRNTLIDIYRLQH